MDSRQLRDRSASVGFHPRRVLVVGEQQRAVRGWNCLRRSGVICVSLNYRLGIEGFLPIPGVPTNLGLRDLVFALHWIRENIHAFGGDPARIVVAGQSAGAMLVGDLVASPLAAGLFQRAILQSGHGSMVRTPEVASRVVKLLAECLGVAANEQGFRSRTIEECLNALDTVMQPETSLDLTDAHGKDPIFGLSLVSPVYDEDLLPEPKLHSLSKGKGKEIDLLIGTNREEMNLYYVPTNVRETITEEAALALLSRSQPEALSILQRYGLGKDGRPPGHVFTDAMTDLVFRMPARQFAMAHQGKTHLCEFTWRSPACKGELGACHALEMPFVFNTLACCTGPTGFVGENPPQALAQAIHNRWVDFAKDGEAQWPEYAQDTEHVLSLETGEFSSEASPSYHDQP